MTSPQPQLVLENVSCHFGGIRAVNGVDLQLDTNDITGLVGPNGAGKTTLFNLITATIRAKSGRILFAGRNITGLTPDAVARLGLVRSFQSPMTLPGVTVREHLRQAALFQAIGRPSFLLRRRRIAAAEAQARRTADAVLDFARLAHVADEPADQLAYGVQKILGVAMAVAAGPRLLLADEPAAGLNGAETAEMERLLRAIHEELSIGVLVIEHDLPMVMRLCSRVIALAQGTVIADGRPHEVRGSRAFIEAYLGSEADAA